MSVVFTHRGTHAVMYFSGALDWDSAVEITDTLETLVSHFFYRTVEVVVTSDGGGTDALEHILSAMRRWEAGGVRLVTRAVGAAQSAGALLVSFGTERVAAPHARLRYHRVAQFDPGAVTADRARALERSLRRLDVDIFARLARRALATGDTAPSTPRAEPSDHAVLEHLVGRRGRRKGRSNVERLADTLAGRVAAAVNAGDEAALVRLYTRLTALDCVISPALACTLRLIDRVDTHYQPVRPASDAEADPVLLVPEWRALYPPDGEVPLKALVRHALILGETGSGKSASAVMPPLAALARAPRSICAGGLVIDPKHELESLLAAHAPDRLRRVVASETVLDVMAGARWSLAADLEAGRWRAAAVRVMRRVLSLVPDVPAAVLEARSTRDDAYWDIEGTDLLISVLAVLLMLLSPRSPDPEALAGDDEAVLQWLRPFHAQAGGEGAERGPNLIALAAWALRGPLMRRCASRAPAPVLHCGDDSDPEFASFAAFRFSGDSGSGDWLFARVARALLSHGQSLSHEAREVLEQVLVYWKGLAEVERTFAGVLGAAVASTSALGAPAVAHTLYFGPEPGCRAAQRAQRCVDFALAVSPQSPGHFYVFQPARDGLDNLIAVALKAMFFEAVLADPHRLRGDPSLPIVAYAADEFQRYITSDRIHGEQGFFDTARSFRGACIVACQSVASLEHALAHGGGGARRDEAALSMLWTNTSTKLVFRTTDPNTAKRLEALCPQRRGYTHVVRARPPATLAPGECYAALPDGRFERRQLEPLLLERPTLALPEPESESAPPARERGAERDPTEKE